MLKYFYLYKLDNQFFSFTTLQCGQCTEKRVRPEAGGYSSKLSTSTDLQASLVAVGLENRLATGIVKTRNW